MEGRVGGGMADEVFLQAGGVNVDERFLPLREGGCIAFSVAFYLIVRDTPNSFVN